MNISSFKVRIFKDPFNQGCLCLSDWIFQKWPIKDLTNFSRAHWRDSNHESHVLEKASCNPTTNSCLVIVWGTTFWDRNSYQRKFDFDLLFLSYYFFSFFFLPQPRGLWLMSHDRAHTCWKRAGKKGEIREREPHTHMEKEPPHDVGRRQHS